MKPISDQVRDLLTSLIQFLWDWTIGLIAQAASLDPKSMGVLQLILWVVVLVFALGFVVWLLYILLQALFWFFSRPLFYRDPYFYFPVLAWVCAFLLIYVKLPVIPFPS